MRWYRRGTGRIYPVVYQAKRDHLAARATPAFLERSPTFFDLPAIAVPAGLTADYLSRTPTLYEPGLSSAFPIADFLSRSPTIYEPNASAVAAQTYSIQFD